MTLLILGTLILLSAACAARYHIPLDELDTPSPTTTQVSWVWLPGGSLRASRRENEAALIAATGQVAAEQGTLEDLVHEALPCENTRTVAVAGIRLSPWLVGYLAARGYGSHSVHNEHALPDVAGWEGFGWQPICSFLP